MSEIEQKVTDDIPLRTQAEITAGYEQDDHSRTPITLGLGHTALEQMKGLAIIDDSSLGAQLRRSVDEYYAFRVTDPTIPNQVAAARQRALGNRPESEESFVRRHTRQEEAETQSASTNVVRYLGRPYKCSHPHVQRRINS